MTIISILSGEWEIAFADENDGGNAVAGLSMVHHVSGTTVITSNALYSAVADAMDEYAAQDFLNPMLPTTPTDYTMENGYFMPNASTQFLEGGAISTTAQDGEVRSIAYTDTVADFAAADVGKQVTGGTTGDTGTLLDFEVLPDGTKLAWIRPDDTATDTFDDPSETLTCTGDSGTGNCTSTAASTTGETLWSNIQVIGGIATNSEVYVVQDKIKLDQWWTTDPTVSLGIIDILVRVKLDDTLIANGEVEVFNRRYAALYGNFLLNVSGGGRSALPLSTADDINNTTGYWSAAWDAGGGSAMTVGDLLTNTTQTGTFAIVTAVTDSGATGTFEYYLVGDLTEWNDGDVFTGTRNGTIDGTPAANDGGPTDPDTGEGGTVTVTLGYTTYDSDGDGTAEPYCITVDALTNVPIAKVYERLKYITRRGAGNTDLFGAGVNMDGEQFRGAQVQVAYDNPSGTGTFTEGDDVNEAGTGGTFTAICLSDNDTDNYLMLTDPFDLSTLINNDTLEDEASDTVDVDGAPTSITPVVVSPFGTFTGTQIFGSRGVLYKNFGSGDGQAYIVTDDNGVLRTPPNTVTVEVTGLETGWNVFMADDNGTAGVIDKDRFSGMTVQAVRAGTITCGATIDSDVPQAGFVRVFDDSAQEEHRYRYASWSGAVFTLDTVTGSADAGGGTTTLIDAVGDFVNNGVKAGDYIYNVTDGGSVGTVVSVDSATQLTTTTMTSWDNSDVYEINYTKVAYTTDDNVFAPIIDVVVEAGDGDTLSNTLVQSTSFGVVANVRYGKTIIPFTQNGTVGSSGLSLPAIKTLDTIAT